MKKLLGFASALLAGIVLLPAGCGDDDATGGGDGAGNNRPDNTGAACAAASDCYPLIDPQTILGEILCLDRVRGGYCTHTCTADADCCAAMGECKTDIEQVCSPFEATGDMMCFLSCEAEDLVPSTVDEQEYCQREAGRDFICRSSGGGANNRKVCVPGDCGVGAACAGGADCATGLECILTLAGGYCTTRGCTSNAECPADSACVRHSDGQNYCFKSCVGKGDCTFCRGWDDLAECAADVEFVEAGTGSVCVPH
jgi:hypothetical protein